MYRGYVGETSERYVGAHNYGLFIVRIDTSWTELNWTELNWTALYWATESQTSSRNINYYDCALHRNYFLSTALETPTTTTTTAQNNRPPRWLFIDLKERTTEWWHRCLARASLQFSGVEAPSSGAQRADHFRPPCQAQELATTTVSGSVIGRADNFRPLQGH